MRNILIATAMILPIAVTAAHATDLVPMQAAVRSLHGGASALVYFEGRPDGYHVVATVQSDNTENMKVFRFTSVLSPGQTMEVSVPHELGASADVVVIRRVGDRMVIDDANLGLASNP